MSTADRKLFLSSAVLMKWSVECGNDPVWIGCGGRVQALVSGKFFPVETVCCEMLTLHVHLPLEVETFVISTKLIYKSKKMYQFTSNQFHEFCMIRNFGGKQIKFVVSEHFTETFSINIYNFSSLC